MGFLEILTFSIFSSIIALNSEVTSPWRKAPGGDMEKTMTIKRVLSFLLLVLAVALNAIPAEAQCRRGDPCWPRYQGGGWGGQGGWYDRYGYYGRNRIVVVAPQVPVVPVERAGRNLRREPGLIDVPLGILDRALGLVFGRTVDTSCADDDVACHRAEGRTEGRYDGKSAVADATEDAAYREAYNEAIRNSGQPVEVPAPAMREDDLESEE